MAQIAQNRSVGVSVNAAARIRADFIDGMGKFAILLNINRVLSVDEIAMLASVAGGGEAGQ